MDQGMTGYFSYAECCSDALLLSDTQAPKLHHYNSQMQAEDLLSLASYTTARASGA